MKYLQKFDLFEKSSLTKIGIPNEVMKVIQYDYEVQTDANWIKLKTKKELKDELDKDELNMFLEVSDYQIKVIVCVSNNNYFIQIFKLVPGAWGGSYEVEKRENITKTQLLKYIIAEDVFYKLDGNFEYKPKKQRKVKKAVQEFELETMDFLLYILENFNKIIQRIYGKKYEFVMKKIANNISNFDPNASAEDILTFLKDNKKMAEKAREYENSKSDEDLLRMNNLKQKYNSLTVIEEYLITFEEEYSEKYGSRLTIKDLIDTFGRMKIETAFMYYLFTGNIKELNIQIEK